MCLWYNCRPPTAYPDSEGYQFTVLAFVCVGIIILLDLYDTYWKYGLRPNNDYHLITP